MSQGIFNNNINNTININTSQQPYSKVSITFYLLFLSYQNSVQNPRIRVPFTIMDGQPGSSRPKPKNPDFPLEYMLD